MKKLATSRFGLTLWQCALALAVLVPASVLAETWTVKVGAQSGDKARQALAFLPNEIWIHAGDSVNLPWVTDETHTATLLMKLQIRPSRLVGCPGVNATPDFSLYDGNECVNSGILKNGQSYTVVFPAEGNFKLVCLAHPDMTATIHVLAMSAPLPHDQEFYEREAERQADALLSDVDDLARHHRDSPAVVTGAGTIIGNGGGKETASVMRFMEATKVIHAGETVEWTTAEAVTSHTITFGTEPADITKPFGNVTTDADGALHAVISSPSDNVNSGFLTQSPQDRTALPQAPLGITRFRVTFTQPGVYNYKCSLHDQLGMLGEIIVLP